MRRESGDHEIDSPAYVMKKFVEVMAARKRGSGLSRRTNHSPFCSSWSERNAIELLSGDQRAFEAFQPDGSNGRGAERTSGHSR